MNDLSPLAFNTCDSHYQGGRGCGRCPIQRQCHSSHPWGQVGLNAWRNKINEAASLRHPAEERAA